MTEPLPERPAMSDDDGSWCFDFICSLPCPFGRVRNRMSFHMKPGDDPMFPLARMLMPGAVLTGKDCLHVPGGEPEAVDGMPGKHYGWVCTVKAGGSVFGTVLYAKDECDLRVMCRDVGGLRPVMDPPLRWHTRLALMGRFLWLRRPRVTLRSPVLVPQ